MYNSNHLTNITHIVDAGSDFIKIAPIMPEMYK